MGEEDEIIGTQNPGEYEEGTQDNETQAPNRPLIKRTLREIIEMTGTEYRIETQSSMGKAEAAKPL